jgi:hypothetical protein
LQGGDQQGALMHLGAAASWLEKRQIALNSFKNAINGQSGSIIDMVDNTKMPRVSKSILVRIPPNPLLFIVAMWGCIRCREIPNLHLFKTNLFLFSYSQLRSYD